VHEKEAGKGYSAAFTAIKFGGFDSLVDPTNDEAEVGLQAGTDNTLQVNSEDWRVDSGASMHISGNKRQFLNYKPYAKGMARRLRGFKGAVVTADGYGDVVLNFRIPGGTVHKVLVREVIYVKGAFNLLSMSRLMDRGYRVKPINYYGINIYSGKQLLAVAPQVDSLFVVDLEHKDIVTGALVTPESSSIVALRLTGIGGPGGVTEGDLWHRRLAHLGIDAVRSMPRVVNGMPAAVSKVTPCDGCVLGKLHRQPFTPNTKRAQKPLDLIHSDICGPMQVASLGGARYFVLFIDDATRFTEVFIIKKKSEALRCFQEYKASVENLHGTNIKALRTDGGGEYTSKVFTQYLKDQGI